MWHQYMNKVRRWRDETLYSSSTIKLQSKLNYTTIDWYMSEQFSTVLFLLGVTNPDNVKNTTGHAATWQASAQGRLCTWLRIDQINGFRFIFLLFFHYFIWHDCGCLSFFPRLLFLLFPYGQFFSLPSNLVLTERSQFIIDVRNIAFCLKERFHFKRFFFIISEHF